MGATHLDALARGRGVGKHRLKAAALVVALAGGLVALTTPQASAATITQDGPRNYAGPAGTCPVDATDCAAIPAGDGNLVINQTTSDPAGYNKVVFASTSSQSGSNTTSDQQASVNQAGASNSIDGAFIATHTVSNGLNLSQVTQTAKQRFTTRQYGDTNVLKIKGQETETASSSLNALTQVT